MASSVVLSGPREASVAGAVGVHERKNNRGKRVVNVSLPCEMTSKKHKPFILPNFILPNFTKLTQIHY